MKLDIKYKESTRNDIAAVFLKGTEPYTWLKEIDTWNISLDDLDFYLIPEAKNNLISQGLFIIFKPNEKLEKLKFLSPYVSVTDNLYIPIHSELTPMVTNEELNKILLYDVQVFYPNLGLIGYNKTEKLDLTTLISLQLEKKVNWNLAHHGLLLKPKLKKIEIVQPSIDDIFSLITNFVENKPLNDINNIDDSKNKITTPFLQQIKIVFFRAILNIFLFLENLFKPKKDVIYSSEVNKKNSFSNWLSDKLDEIERYLNESIDNAEYEKKRNNEIEKLIDLFDTNLEEALKYSVPLDSPYENRGVASRSSGLFRKAIDFTLKNLGGGYKVDTFNIDNYYYTLRGKYLDAAEKEIESKNFRKAAYIYANLLGDFYSAGNVLEQGKFYREASILYKEHLKDFYRAGDCLEKAGLILEAIDIFKNLELFEKVAELYEKINLEKEAHFYYEKAILILIENKNYLDASVIILEKLKQNDRAKKVLLDAWFSNSNQNYICLKKYFELIEVNELNSEIKNIYNSIEIKEQRDVFLEVLFTLRDNNDSSDFLEIFEDITYRVINENLEEGNFSNLKKLKKLFPNDLIIPSDYKRFITNNIKKLNPEKIENIYLDSSIEWFKTVSFDHQFIVFGKKNDRLYIARGNWYGNIEYHYWKEKIEKNEIINIISNPENTNNILIQANKTIFEIKKLQKNKYFDKKILITSNNDLQHEVLAVSNNNKSDVINFKRVNNSVNIHRFSRDVHSIKILDFELDIELLTLLLAQKNINPSKMISLKDPNCSNMEDPCNSNYTFKNNLLLKIEEHTNEIKSLFINEKIEDIAHFYSEPNQKIVIRTENNFYTILEDLDSTLDKTQELNIEIFFKKSIEYVDMIFLNENEILIASNEKIYLYDFIKNTDYEIYKSNSTIISILKTNKNKQCAVLENNGRIIIIDF